MNALFQLLNPNNTISVNRPLAHAVGLNEAFVYGALVAKFYWYSEREMLDNGWFYSTVPDLQESTALSEKQQKRCIDNLIKAGLIRCELRGMPAKRSFFIVEDTDLIQRLLSEGEAAMHQIKPAAAEGYEKKRKSSEPNETTKRFMEFLSESFGAAAEDENTENGTEDVVAEEKPHDKAVCSCSAKRAEQAPTKGKSLLRQKGGASSAETSEQHFIKTKVNKTKVNNLSINQSEDEFSDVIDEIGQTSDRDVYRDVIHGNIGYDFMLENAKSPKFGVDLKQVDEIVDLMLDVVCSSKETIRINGENMPHEVVKSRFLKLDEDHIRYVLERIKSCKTEIKNIRAYLLTTLYNAPSTMENYYTVMVNSDLYGVAP